MPDIIKKAIPANAYKNSNIVLSTLPNGTFDTLESRVTNDVDPTKVEQKYSDRFDKITYYSN